MRYVYFVFITIVFTIVLAPGSWAQVFYDQQGKQELPSVFIENKGQWDDNVIFQGSTGSSNVTFLKDGLSFGYLREAETQNEMEIGLTEMLVWNLKFEGVDPNVNIKPKGKKDSRINFFKGNDPSRWVSNAPVWSMIRYKDIYPGIDLHYYLSGNRLKYDYILAPATDPGKIKLSGKGIEKIEINRRGQLEITTPWGILLEEIPYSYQLINGVKQEVEVNYEIYDEGIFGFRIAGDYDPNSELVIDPVFLEWGTFSGALDIKTHSYMGDLDTDKNGHVYSTGKSPEFKTTPGVYSPNLNGATHDAFVFKLDASGSNMIWATYFGGNKLETGLAVEIDDSGSVYVVGGTASDDLPTVNALQPAYAGQSDLFLVKFASDGASLVYSTYIGGTDRDHFGLNEQTWYSPGGTTSPVSGGAAFKVNKSGEAFIGGFTQSNDFPGLTDTINGGRDAYLMKMAASGNAVEFTYHFGGSSSDYAVAIDLDNNGNVFIAGKTYSADFPVTSGALDTIYDPGSAVGGAGDIFIMKYDPVLDSVIYSTFLPGDHNDGEYAMGLAVNSAGEAFLAGTTRSSDLGTNTKPDSFVGRQDLFAVRLNAAGDKLIYATYFGGTGNYAEMASGVALASDNSLFISGTTQAGNLEMRCAYDSTFNGGKHDAFLVVVNDTGALQFSTYIGGNANDYGNPRVALIDDGCNVSTVIGVTTHSTNFPVTQGAYLDTFPNISSDPFKGASDQPAVAKLTASLGLDFEINATPCVNQNLQFTDKTSGACIFGRSAVLTTWQWDFGDGSTSTEKSPKHAYSKPGTYTVKLIAGCPNDTVVKQITVTEQDDLPLELGNDTSLCEGDSISLDANALGVTYNWSTGDTSSILTVKDPGSYWVEIRDGVCYGQDTVDINFDQAPVLDLQDSSLCGNDTLVLDAGNPGMSYFWSTGATTQTTRANGSGTYWVEIRNGACYLFESTQLTFSDPIEIDFGNDTALCPGQSLSLNAQNPFSQYEWNTGQTAQVITVDSSGTYTVKVTIGDCSHSDSITVLIEDVSIDLGGDTTICSGDSVTFEVDYPGAQYTWSDGGTTGSITVDQSGTYHVSVQLQGCGDSDTVQVTIHGPVEVDLGNDSTICTSGSFVLDAGIPGAEYSWSTGETTQQIGIQTSGTYHVQVSDKGCSGSDTVNIVVVSLGLDLGNDTILCEPAKVNLDADIVAESYLWSTGATTQAISVTDPSIYWVTITKASCTISDTLEIQHANKPDLGADQILCPGETMQLSSGLLNGNLIWSTGDTTANIIGTAGDIYWVRLDYAHCIFSDTIELGEVPGAKDLVNMPNVFTPNADNINDFFYPELKMSYIGTYRLTIYNRWGNKLYETSEMSGRWDGKFKKDAVPEGVYYWILDYTSVCSPEIPVEDHGTVTLLRAGDRWTK